jgi:nitrite reductase (NADH) small subunit
MTTGTGTDDVTHAEHFVAMLADLPLHRIHRVRIEGREIGIVRTANSVHAIGNRCPHQGAPMCLGRVTGTMVASAVDEYVYDHDGLVVQCPWHAYEFHLDTGISVGGVVRGRVPVFTVAIRDGRVYCSLRRPAPGGLR